jgi:hypothetical protein
MTMNLLDWVQVVFSLVVLLIGFYIAFSRAPAAGGQRRRPAWAASVWHYWG